ncbi:MAG: di-heme oxidoredictase family protein [Candidatus Sulfotelmatobacter sp.]
MKARTFPLLALLLFVGVLAISLPLSHHVSAGTCTTKCAPPPPPPPTVGQFGGPLTGLSQSITALFNGGYATFATKWDPIRGLGPVSTETGCFDCHGAGIDVLTGTAGDTGPIVGQRYGKWNPDGTFNYLDGTGTYPDNEGGPVVHGLSNSAFGTLPACNIMTITGATESGTTVTLTTSANHQFTVGQMLQVQNVPVAGYNGIFIIASIPSSTTLTYTNTVSGLASSSGGTTSNLPHESVPADATVNSNVRSPNLFGAGLIDNIPDEAILANVGVSKPYNITGVANMIPDENGVVRPGKFGQKLNVVSLFQFTANAEFNELGITNDNSLFGVSNQFFPTEHNPQAYAENNMTYPTACQPDGNTPQDVDQVNIIKMTQFQSLLAPIPPQPPTSATEAGLATFNSIGCSVCHIINFTTQANVTLRTTTGGKTAVIPSLSNVTFSPYSDFLLHDMGSGDSGGIPYQPAGTGQADLTMWRTSPLWGLSNTLMKAGGLMHDNLSPGINAAIVRHGGEAATVEASYEALSPTDQSNLIAFLSSL